MITLILSRGEQNKTWSSSLRSFLHAAFLPVSWLQLFSSSLCNVNLYTFHL